MHKYKFMTLWELALTQCPYLISKQPQVLHHGHARLQVNAHHLSQQVGRHPTEYPVDGPQSSQEGQEEDEALLQVEQ